VSDSRGPRGYVAAMNIEKHSQTDLPLDDELASSVSGGRKTSRKPRTAAVKTASVVVPSQPVATTQPAQEDVPNTPLPISPFGDDCIPAEYARNPGTSD
jgi:hypothetical protein